MPAWLPAAARAASRARPSWSAWASRPSACGASPSAGHTLTDLLDRAVRALRPATAGEAIEIYLGKGADTEIIVRGGTVASLSHAVSEGVGVRVVLDHRVGFAFETSLD